MARSFSIWLVVRHDYDGVHPLAAFTVKHEMVTWLREQDEGFLTGCSVVRMPDGTEDAGKTFRIEELLNAL